MGANCCTDSAEPQIGPPVKVQKVFDALAEACWWGNADEARKLLDKGADVNEKDATGSTPLHKAAYAGHLSCVSLLLERGAQVDAKDKNGSTPSHLALRMGYDECVSAMLEYSRTHRQLDGRKAENPLVLQSFALEDYNSRLSSMNSGGGSSKGEVLNHVIQTGMRQSIDKVGKRSSIALEKEEASNIVRHVRISGEVDSSLQAAGVKKHWMGSGARAAHSSARVEVKARSSDVGQKPLVQARNSPVPPASGDWEDRLLSLQSDPAK